MTCGLEIWIVNIRMIKKTIYYTERMDRSILAITKRNKKTINRYVIKQEYVISFTV